MLLYVALSAELMLASPAALAPLTLGNSTSRLEIVMDDQVGNGEETKGQTAKSDGWMLCCVAVEYRGLMGVSPIGCSNWRKCSVANNGTDTDNTAVQLLFSHLQ